MKDEDEDLAGVYVARAMFALAASCEPPSLRPDCPYSVAVAGGVRTCKQQCHEILERHQIRPPGPDLVPLPLPQAERVPRAFDASERYLPERGRHMSRWSLSALLWALRQHLTRTPVGVAGPGDPQRETRECLAELARRGLDVESVVRRGLGSYIVTALTIAAALPPLPEELTSAMASPLVSASPLPGSAPSVRVERVAWAALLDEIIDSERLSEGVGDVLPFPDPAPGGGMAGLRRRVAVATHESFQIRLRTWLATAPMSEIVGWTAPPSARFGSFAEGADATQAQRDEARWLVDRFTKLDYDDWSPASLHLEFRWSRTGKPVCCPEEYMQEHPVQRLELAETIAATAVSRPESHELQRALRLKAITLVSAGQHDGAAVLLDESRKLNDEAPEPHSDYAFCVMPDDVPAALRALDRAEELGWRSTVSVGNRALCLALLGRDKEALREAARVLGDYEQEDVVPSYMWDPASALGDRPWILLRNVIPRDYVLDLGALIASRIGEAAEAYWLDEANRIRQRAA